MKSRTLHSSSRSYSLVVKEILLLGILLLHPSLCWAERDTSIVASVYVSKEGAFDGVMTDLISVHLSQVFNLHIVERRELSSLLKEEEFSRRGFVDVTQFSKGLSLLGAEIIINVECIGEYSKLTVLHASSRRIIATEPLKSCAAAEVASEVKLRVEALLTSDKIKSVDSRDPGSTIAILRTDEERESSVVQGKIEHLLSQRGFTLLTHRELKMVREEQALYQGGLSSDTSSAWQPILGARYLLQLETKKHRAVFIDTHTGIRLGEVPLSDDPLPVVNWIIHALHTKSAESSATNSKNGTLSFEASEVFCRGIRLYAQGKPFEAFESFLFALSLSPSNSDIKEWACSSLVASGFKEVREDWKWCHTHPREATAKNNARNNDTAFLGVVSEDGESERYTNSLELILLGILRDQNSSVYVTEDLKNIQDEFDALVGVKRAVGFSRIQPGVLREGHVMVGSVHHNQNGQVVLTLFRDSHAVNEVVLPMNTQEWKVILQNFLKTLDSNSTVAFTKEASREDLRSLWTTLRETYEREGGHIRSPVLPLKILSQESTQIGLIPYISLEGILESDLLLFKRMLYLKALPKVVDASLKLSIERVIEAPPQVVQLRAAPWDTPRFVRKLGNISLPSTPIADDEGIKETCTMSVEEAPKHTSRILWCAEFVPRYLTTTRSQQHLISAFFSLNKSEERTVAYKILETIKGSRDEHNEPTDPEIYGNALYHLARLTLEDNDPIEAFDIAKEGMQWVKGKPFHLLTKYLLFVDNNSLETHFSELLNKMRDESRGRVQ